MAAGCLSRAALAESADVVSEIQTILQASDSFAAIEHIQRDGTPLEIAGRYQSFIPDLYWKAHDLPAIIAIGRAGIIYCLGQSLAVDISAESAEKLRSIAKGIAYNVGSFSWPGWEEPGIAPTVADLIVGMDCARLNLRLAIELKKPPVALSKAHWLVGAHALTSENFELAEREFRLARDVLPAIDEASKNLQWLNQGFLAVAQMCSNPADAAATARFEQIIAELRADNGDDAKVYLPQLMSARRLFVPGK